MQYRVHHDTVATTSSIDRRKTLIASITMLIVAFSQRFVFGPQEKLSVKRLRNSFLRLEVVHTFSDIVMETVAPAMRIQSASD